MITFASSTLSRGGSLASRTRAAPRSRVSITESSSSAAVIGANSTSASVIPPWRIASKEAVWAGVSSGSRGPTSEVSASPIPRPARTCGITVHAADAEGRKASARTPAPTRAQPVIARSLASPRSRVPTSAETGTIATTRAASSGDSDHPETSRRTSRNNTALSAAETRASAVAGPSWMRSRVGGFSCRPAWDGDSGTIGSPREARNAAAESAPTGACTRKIARQSSNSVRSPPKAGPAAAPSTAAEVQSRSRSRSPAVRKAKPQTSPAAAPSACSPRRMRSGASEPTRPHPNPAAAKTTKPAAPRRLEPICRRRRSAGISAAASTSV